MEAGLILILDSLFNIMWLAVFARVIVSWMNIDPYSPVVQFLYTITEPLLAPIRQFMPQGMMFDLSPMIAIIVLLVARELLQVIILSVF